MKDFLGIVVVAFAAMISVSRSCAKTTKVVDNVKPNVVRTVKNVDDSKSKSVVKYVGTTKNLGEAYKLLVDSTRNDKKNNKSK